MSQENLTLEENQKKGYNSRVAVYEFICEGAGVTSHKSPQFAAIKNGIRLHFLRFGLFNKNSEEDIYVKAPSDETKNGGELDEVEVIRLKDTPDFENFYVARTALNVGYLYIMDDADENLFFEYEINNSGKFSPVLWKDNKDENGNYLDIRKASGKQKSYEVLKPDSVVWIAYSPVQWSVEYHKSLLTDPEKRKERMLQVNCSGFTKGEENPHDSFYILPYNKLTATYTPEQKAQAFWLEECLNNINIDETAEDPNNENTLLEDMFITLHDPIGCAADLSNDLAGKILNFKALVDAIQTGETQEEAYQRILNGELEGPQPKKTEYQSLISLALTCYHMVYNDDETILQFDGGSPGKNYSDRYSLDPRPTTKPLYGRDGRVTFTPNTSIIGNGLDYQKIEGILGIKERTSLRQEIQKYKDDFGEFLKSKYFNSVLVDYLHNLTEHILEGRSLLLEIIDPLATNLYDFDRHLLLRKDYKKTDVWIDWVFKLIDKEYEKEFTGSEVKNEAPGYENLNPLYALLGTPLNIDKVLDKTRGISIKLAKAYKKLLKHYAGQAFAMKKVNGKMFREIEKLEEFIVKKLNTNLKVHGHEMFHIEDGEIRLRLEELGVEIDDEFAKKGKYTGKKEDILRILKESEGKGIKAQKTRKGRRVENKVSLKVRKHIDDENVIKTNAKNLKISKIINGKAFNGVFLALEIINFGYAFGKLNKDPEWKSLTNFFGSTVKLTEAGLNLQKARINDVNSKVAQQLGKNATRLSIVGGAFTAGMCFWDSIEAFNKRDIDSGLALTGAGVAFGLSTAAPYLFAASVAGPVGWIAAGIGVGLITIAMLVTDTELEELFKNFLLSDIEDFPKQQEDTPMVYSRKVLDNKHLLVDDDYTETLMHPADAEATLLDAIICKEIIFTPTNTKITGDSWNPYYNSMGMKTHTVYEFNVTMTFYKFFNREDQVECKIFFFPQGIDHKKYIEIEVETHDVCKIKNSKGQDALELAFAIPRKHRSLITDNSEIVFALRLALDAGHSMYFPYNRKKKERFLGAKIKSQGARIMLTTMKQEKNVKSLPLDELLGPEIW